jgi:hypothetical protein
MTSDLAKLMERISLLQSEELPEPVIEIEKPTMHPLLQAMQELKEDGVVESVDAHTIYSNVQSGHREPDDFIEGDIGDRIYWFDDYKLSSLPISNLNLDEHYVDEDLVDDYIEHIKYSPKTMPPIVYDPIAKSIIDGIHRANAYAKLGYETIPAYVGLTKSDSYGERESEQDLEEYNIRKTKKFIQRAHDQEQGQMYGDMPYSSHPKQVANLGKKFFGPKFNDEAVKVALLHDVLEDTPYTPEQLAKKGFSKEVIQAVQLLTKNKALSYADNIRNIINSGNPLAMMVKYSDNYMNYSGDKSHWDADRAAHSQKKYLASLNMLGDVLGIKKHVGEEPIEEASPNTLEGSFTPDLVESKTWLCDMLAKGLKGKNAGTIYVLGSWYGNIGIFLEQAGVQFDKLVLVEPDEEALMRSKELLQPLNDSGKLILIHQNAEDVVYEKPGVVINTSCNETGPVFLTKLPDNMLCLLQARNNNENTLFPTEQMEDFVDYFPLQTVYYTGEKQLEDPEVNYTRFMKIGRAGKKLDEEFHTGGSLGTPYPGTYEQEYDMFKSTGQRRITSMTSEGEL